MTNVDPALWRLVVCRGAIKLEMLGMKHSRGSVTAMIKKEFGWKGNRKKIFEQLDAYIHKICDERGMS